MFDAIFDRFAQKRPVATIARVLIERIFAPERLDALFARSAEQQYTRELLFSSVFGLMAEAVQGSQPSVNAAYKARDEPLNVSIQAVYEKLRGIEPNFCRDLLRDGAEQARELIKTLYPSALLSLPGYRIKLLDGNCIAASEHRIKELRTLAAGALPGKSLVVLDPQLGIPVDLFPCEDGHAQERSLLAPVLDTIAAKDLWIADRNFCTKGFLAGIAQRGAYFNIREHANLCFEPLGPAVLAGKADDAQLYVQNVEMTDHDGQRYRMRRITVKLDQPTRDGETAIFLLCNLPNTVAVRQIAELYRKRWTIETAFQELTTHLNCEINALGYPRAALFGFTVACLSYIVLITCKAALRAALGAETSDGEISGYYLAVEMRNASDAFDVALPASYWQPFRTMPLGELCQQLVQMARNMQLRRYRKQPRGPKKPPPKRAKNRKQPHVSTAQLIAKRSK